MDRRDVGRNHAAERRQQLSPATLPGERNKAPGCWDIFLPRWTTHGGASNTASRRIEEASYTATRHGSMAGVSHREREPQVVVKLSYDGDKKLTVAVLSQQLDGLSVYFQCRVEQGTAFQRSPLYYELVYTGSDI